MLFIIEYTYIRDTADIGLLDRYAMRQRRRYRKLSRRSQTIRFGLFFIAYMVSILPLGAAITLQDLSPSDAKFVLVQGGERSSIQELPIAELYIQAKHRGKGNVSITYTPLTNGTASVLYQMVKDDGRQIGGGFCAEYMANKQQRRTYRLCSLKALLFCPLREEETNLKSTIILNLSVEL